MHNPASYQRAEMPSGTEKVLDNRSVQKSNSNLLSVLQKGQCVLDMGCGSGTITNSICPYVGSEGFVVGVDRSEDLIGQAKNKFQDVPNLRFDLGDILNYDPKERFDVITSSRVLQWLSNPGEVIQKLVSLLKPGGVICILDYNHSLIQWQPSPPDSMRRFYDAFLRWRSDAGMDNEIANHVAELMRNKGLSVVYDRDHSEQSDRGTASFESEVNLWTIVAETRGKQMVADNYVTEEDRALAAKEYSEWCKDEAQTMKLDLRAIHGALTST